MSLEGVVDVFQTVKNLRIQRPAMVQTLVGESPSASAHTHTHTSELLLSPQAQYQFCYDATLDYIESSEILQAITKRFDSSASDIRRRARNASPARSESLSRKGSFRNRELAGGVSGSTAHVYGGSDATSTFGTQGSPSPRSSSVSGGSQVHLALAGQAHLSLPSGATPPTATPTTLTESQPPPTGTDEA